mmetsp:Transcript_21742/g.51108  ORF Transcript_21742/g.51108 Transcript_21742/m.51108 type:complete len:239 (+) Transcript_21742:1191-1907(+)
MRRGLLVRGMEVEGAQLANPQLWTRLVRRRRNRGPVRAAVERNHAAFVTAALSVESTFNHVSNNHGALTHRAHKSDPLNVSIVTHWVVAKDCHHLARVAVRRIHGPVVRPVLDFDEHTTLVVLENYVALLRQVRGELELGHRHTVVFGLKQLQTALVILRSGVQMTLHHLEPDSVLQSGVMGPEQIAAVANVGLVKRHQRLVSSFVFELPIDNSFTRLSPLKPLDKIHLRFPLHSKVL